MPNNGVLNDEMLDSQKVAIMDIPFENTTMDDMITHRIPQYLNEKKKCFIVTANPEIVMATRKDPHYKEIVKSADFVLPDGVGIIYAAKRKKQPLQERIAGFDLMQQLLNLANEQGLKCFFLGSSEEVNRAAVDHIIDLYPNIKVAGRHHGYFDLDDDVVKELVKETEPDFTFVALGFPKQEQWIAKFYHEFNQGVFIGVGGSLDVLSGTVKRAPQFWIKLNLEWLYRILKQPFRIKRILPVFKFIWLSFIRKV